MLVPFGGGGLSCGIAAALRALRPEARVFGCEVETAAPLAASLAAGSPQTVDYTPSFVDGIGGKSLLPEMWPLVSSLLAGSRVVSLEAGRGRRPPARRAPPRHRRGRRRRVVAAALAGVPRARRCASSPAATSIPRSSAPSWRGGCPGRKPPEPAIRDGRLLRPDVELETERPFRPLEADAEACSSYAEVTYRKRRNASPDATYGRILHPHPGRGGSPTSGTGCRIRHAVADRTFLACFVTGL